MSKESLLLNKDLQNDFSIQKVLNSALLLGLILLLGITLRFYNLGTESYWIDEMSTVIEGQQSIQQLFASGRLDQPPAYYLPFHFWVQFFGATEISTRLFSALIGIGSIVLVYLIGLELFGKEVGLLSAFLMSISEFQIYYSQVARFYSFFEFTVLLSFLFLILALKGKRMIQFALYGLASILMVYSHTYGMFILAAQAIYFILRGKSYRDLIATWFICQVLILLAIVPYFYPLIFGEGGVDGAVDLNIGGLSPPSLLDPLRSVYRFIMPGRRDRSWEIMFVNYAVAGTLLVASTWIYATKRGIGNLLIEARGLVANVREVPGLNGKLLLVSCWLLCPIMLPFLLSFAIGPMYQDHYTISAAPALYLLLALGIFIVRKLVPIIISLGVLVVMIAPNLGYYYATDIHEQWREVAAFVDANSKQNDAIVFAPNQGIGIEQRSFMWYYNGTLKSYGLGTDLTDSNEVSEALDQFVSEYDRIWVIMRNDPNDLVHKAYFLNPTQSSMHLIGNYHFFEISVYLFELSK